MRFEGWLESGVVGVEGAGERVADLEGGGGEGVKSTACCMRAAPIYFWCRRFPPPPGVQLS